MADVVIPKFGVLTYTPDFKPGDPPPSGYNDWHAWAEVQAKAGLKQKSCGVCGKWKFPQEHSAEKIVSRPINGRTGKRVRKVSPICKECVK